MNILMLGRWLPASHRPQDASRELRFARRLAQDHQLTLAFTTDEADPSGSISALRSEFSDLEFAVVPRGWRCLVSALTLATGGSCSLAYFRSAALTARLADRARATRFDLVFASASSMLQYALSTDDGIPLVVDFADVDSQWWLRQASVRSQPAAAFCRTEATRLRLAEATAARRARRTVVASPEAGRALASISDGAAVTVIPSGVCVPIGPADVEADAPCAVAILGVETAAPRPPSSMRLTHSVVAGVRTRVPGVRFVMPSHHAGSIAGSGVEPMSGGEAGRDALRCATVAFVPLAPAWGAPSDVLVAMAAGVPVVTTTGVAASIGAQPGHDLFAGDDETSLTLRVVQLLNSPDLRASMADRGVAFVRRQYSWERAVGRVAQLVADVAGTRSAPSDIPVPADAASLQAT